MTKSEVKQAEAVEVGTGEREVAPDMFFINQFGDDRRRIEVEMDAKYPEFKHLWQAGDISQDILDRKRMSVVEVNGKRTFHGGDVLCRQPIEVFRAIHARDQEVSMRPVRRLVKDEASVMHERKVKKVKKTE